MKKVFVIFIILMAILPFGVDAVSSNEPTENKIYTRFLEEGSIGTDVTSLQTFLEDKGFLTIPPGVAKGYFGNITKNALAAYQGSVGIDPLGIVGPATRAKLNSYLHSIVGQTAVVKPPKASLEISGWIPYWRKATGTAEAINHIDTFTELNPFGYTVKNDGTLFDAMKISEEPWTTLIAAAKAKNIRVIPTVMWSNTEAIHRILSNTKTRIALEDEIAAIVMKNDFDGIDIDFEGKKAETKNYFSTFLKGLYQRMGKKWVMCTIEARTPLDSRYDNIPSDIRYANDFVAINKYCDRVRFMTYDQGTIDIVLNRARMAPYIPVADPAWVEKTINLAAETIPKKKISIGIATYGYEYKVTKLSEYGYRYDLEWAFNPRYATELAATLGIIPMRNGSGELSFMYTPTTTSVVVENNNEGNSLIPTSTVADNMPSSQMKMPTNIVWWSDAVAIGAKIDLARRLGVRGVSIFKIDGGADSGMWNVLK